MPGGGKPVHMQKYLRELAAITDSPHKHASDRVAQLIAAQLIEPLGKHLTSKTAAAE